MWWVTSSTEGVDQPDRLDRADFYTSYLQFSYPDTMLIVKARGPATALLPTMRNAVASVDPSLPIYDAMSLDERIGTAIARPRFNMTLLAAFTSASLLLAAIGVYGMLSYSVSSRIRDIGVRLALGADPGRVMRRVLGQGLRLAALGAAIGFIASVAAGRVVRNLLPDARIGIHASSSPPPPSCSVWRVLHLFCLRGARAPSTPNIGSQERVRTASPASGAAPTIDTVGRSMPLM